MGLFDFGEKLPNPELFDVVNELYAEMWQSFDRITHAAEAAHPGVTNPEVPNNVVYLDEHRQKRQQELANGALNGAAWEDQRRANLEIQAKNEARSTQDFFNGEKAA